ncbi:MAG: agenet domain-containing protein [Pirellulales bacterium]
MLAINPRKVFRATAAFALLVAAPTISRADSDELGWDPVHTWVFAVGLLQWEHSDVYPSFPAAMQDRRDTQLVEFFRGAGVPDEQITYLKDAEATKARVQSEFRTLLHQTDENDLFIFYFCGHGARDPDSEQTWFACYDAGDTYESAWSVRSIFTAIDNHFSGSRALLLADCCHSGALYDECRRRNRDDGDEELAYAALTSSYSHNTSTGNWTYTDSLLAGFRGEGQVDLNYDGVIELNELAHYTDLELAFLEGQKSMFFSAAAFPAAAKLAWVENEAAPRVGQRIEVQWKDRWYKAKVIDVDGDQVEVHYAGFDNSWNEWVGPYLSRPYQPAQFAQGDKVEVQWQSDHKWYPATVQKAWYGLHLINYDSEDKSTNEWVGPASIRLRTQ